MKLGIGDYDGDEGGADQCRADLGRRSAGLVDKFNRLTDQLDGVVKSFQAALQLKSR